MLIKNKKFERKISLNRETRDGILSFCKMNKIDRGVNTILNREIVR